MYILGVSHGHDASATLYRDYQQIAAIALERMTRIKGDGAPWPQAAVQECLESAGIGMEEVEALLLDRGAYDTAYIKTRLPFKYRARRFLRNLKSVFGAKKKPLALALNVLMAYHNTNSETDVFDTEAYLADFGIRLDMKVFFYNHHFAHALGALFCVSGRDALVYTSDGWGDGVHMSHRILDDTGLHTLYGGDDDAVFGDPRHTASSLGMLYLWATETLGFTPNRHEGKVLGLAAFGKPVFADALKCFYRVDEAGRIFSSVARRPLRAYLKKKMQKHKREDVAASVQKVLEELVLESVGNLLKRHPARCLAVSGGVFANVRLNQRLVEELPVDEIFIYPAMGDQGIAAGGVLQYLLERDGLETWLSKREELQTVYLGRDYDNASEAAFEKAGAVKENYEGALAQHAAALIEAGEALGICQGRMEYGPRSLGNRSILAAPVDRKINDWLNKRLSRTEFMPFAPVVREERAKEVFKLPDSMMVAARFMTITCDVRATWREKIPAVVHVDGTARPQVIRRAHNPLYYDILHAYEMRTGVPVLINTSFNAHEEPIINTPEEAARALMAGRVDGVITHNALWRARSRRAP